MWRLYSTLFAVILFFNPLYSGENFPDPRLYERTVKTVAYTSKGESTVIYAELSDGSTWTNSVGPSDNQFLIDFEEDFPQGKKVFITTVYGRPLYGLVTLSMNGKYMSYVMAMGKETKTVLPRITKIEKISKKPWELFSSSRFLIELSDGTVIETNSNTNSVENLTSWKVNHRVIVTKTWDDYWALINIDADLSKDRDSRTIWFLDK